MIDAGCGGASNIPPQPVQIPRVAVPPRVSVPVTPMPRVVVPRANTRRVVNTPTISASRSKVTAPDLPSTKSLSSTSSSKQNLKTLSPGKNLERGTPAPQQIKKQPPPSQQLAKSTGLKNTSNSPPSQKENASPPNGDFGQTISKLLFPSNQPEVGNRRPRTLDRLPRRIRR